MKRFKIIFTEKPIKREIIVTVSDDATTEEYLEAINYNREKYLSFECIDITDEKDI